jgi:hypothetical protein
MNGERERRAPGTLSERLKNLDEVGPTLGPLEFDLGAIMLGGERRRRRRTAAGVGTAVVTAGASLALVAVFAGALPGVVQPDPEGASAAAVDVAYVQQGDAVLVSAAGSSLARVTLESVEIDAGGRGAVEVSVESDHDFVLDAEDFVWASDARDRSPADIGGGRSVAGAQRFRWTYDEVSAGELAWTLPGTERLAAVWQIGPASSPGSGLGPGEGSGPGAGMDVSVGTVRRDRVWYLQREKAVTVYQGKEPKARVTVAVGKDPGRTRVQLSARTPYGLRRDDLVWVSLDGLHHAPAVDPWGSLKVEAGGIATATVDFGDVGDGSVLWAPDGGETVGVWSHEAGRDG